jgi:outer membrane protein assembly factor BamB
LTSCPCPGSAVKPSRQVIEGAGCPGLNRYPDEPAIGRFLERLKEQWVINNNRYRSELSNGIEWIFPAYSISQVEPIVHSGAIFWAATDYHVYRVNFLDGRAVWETKLDAEIRENAICYVPGLRRVFVGTQKGSIYSLSYEDGEIMWSSRALRMRRSKTLALGSDYFHFRCVVANERVVLTSTGSISSFDSVTGELIATARTFDELLTKLDNDLVAFQ